MSQDPQDRMDDGAGGQLRGHLAVLWIRKWSMLLVTLLVVGGALAYSVRQVPIYQSQALVLTQAPNLSAQDQGGPQAVNLQTERQVVASSEVAELVVEAESLTVPPTSLLRNLSVDRVPETEILSISYADAQPIRAQQLAQAFADGYLEYRRNQALDQLLAAQETIDERVRAAQRELRRAIARLDDAVEGTGDYLALQAEVSSLSARVGLLEQQAADLTNTENLQVGQIMEPAALPGAPVSPNHVRTGVLALIAGVMLGVAVAFLRERLDDILRGRTDFERLVGAPVLAVVPAVSAWRRRKEADLVTVTDPKAPVSETIRTVRTSLLFAASQNGIKTVMVASAHAGEGKTTVSANLAAALAQAGKRVILVSSDLRKPRLHHFFSGSNGTGLTSVLSQEMKPWEALEDTGIPRLKLMPSGPVPGNPSELLGSEAMGQLIAQLREVADFVVLDSAPVLVAADATALASHTDAVLIIADADRTTRGAVLHARQQLEQVDARVIGAVLNKFDASKKGGYAYYYYDAYYQYGYYGGEEKARRKLRGRKSRKRRKDARFVETAGAGEDWGFQPARPEDPATGTAAAAPGEPKPDQQARSVRSLDMDPTLEESPMTDPFLAEPLEAEPYEAEPVDAQPVQTPPSPAQAPPREQHVPTPSRPAPAPAPARPATPARTPRATRNEDGTSSGPHGRPEGSREDPSTRQVQEEDDERPPRRWA